MRFPGRPETTVAAAAAIAAALAACGGTPDAAANGTARTTGAGPEPAGPAGALARSGAVASTAPDRGTLRTFSFHSRNIYCHNCVARIRARLEELGVSRITADVDAKTMTGEFDPSRIQPAAIRQTVEELGYPVDSFTVAPAR